MEIHFWIWSAVLVLDSTIDANSFNQLIIGIKNCTNLTWHLYFPALSDDCSPDGFRNWVLLIKPSSNLFLAINENSQDKVVNEVSVSGEDDTDEVDDTFQSNIGNGKDADDIDIDDVDEAS